MEECLTDVLVIGAGAAGLRAAISAKESGQEVCVISKGRPGMWSSTQVSGGAFAARPKHASPDRHLEKTLRAGRGINQKELVEILVEEAPKRLRELLDWGIRGVFQGGNLYANGPPPVWGREIIRCLKGKNRVLGTAFQGGLLAVSLKMEKGGGLLLAHRSDSGGWMLFRAKAVVLATGGAGALYLRHDNPRRMLGDGYVLALSAGATLQDMEFMQFYPLALAEPGIPSFLIPPRLAALGRLTNTRGQNVLEKYEIFERPAAEKARDRLSQALFIETARNGQQVLLDLRDVSKNAWCKDPFSASTLEILGKRCGAFHRALRVAPIAHHFMGGVRIDSRGATSIPGLFAAGEVTGGLHGANRLGGNALSETLVFGARAGSFAAKWAREGGEIPSNKTFEAPPFSEDVSPKSGPRARPAEVLQKLQRLLWEKGGIIRNRQGLTKALSELKSLEQEAPRSIPSRNPRQAQRTWELQAASRTAELLLQSAAKREESRGAHFREDFPFQDDPHWRGHHLIRLTSEGTIAWKFLPVHRDENPKK